MRYTPALIEVESELYSDYAEWLKKVAALKRRFDEFGMPLPIGLARMYAKVAVPAAQSVTTKEDATPCAAE